jgi:hypothetical protein
MSRVNSKKKIIKKNMVSISKKDLLKLLVDNEHYQKQIVALQERVKDLKSQLAAAPRVDYIRTVDYPPPPLSPTHPDLEPPIMFGGARYEFSHE